MIVIAQYEGRAVRADHISCGLGDLSQELVRIGPFGKRGSWHLSLGGVLGKRQNYHPARGGAKVVRLNSLDNFGNPLLLSRLVKGGRETPQSRPDYRGLNRASI